ncbi:MAG: hypothetical protein MHPSP_001117, partial [Paramarteilia canceri]
MNPFGGFNKESKVTSSSSVSGLLNWLGRFVSVNVEFGDIGDACHVTVVPITFLTISL